ncbi:signal peptidase II [Gracilibacillus ureilyticus]|uniref:Lipoprotein signal peptidase n=1 Tax=Gracilibacillus ureilyticus TaxID=531814 RepID=A0A1H9KZM5_9BACI|nr:signal peptidase II [Gracilibacillus ureilyticus]SER04508.1 signal peptidase II [Gracilibacillus ureilyticus]
MLWVYIVAVVIIGLDQLTKLWIVQNMELGDQITVIENVFYLTSHRNTGAAWGILAGQMIFFYIITTIVIGFVIYYIQKYGKDSKLLGLSLALVLGGAIGNFIDRLFRKEVVDFFDIYIGSYDYPIFNIADSALVVGVILIFIGTILDERNKKRSKNA